MIETASGIGTLIREWRTRRRMSQLDLASEAEISQRHLSFIESGRSQPSREMIQRLAEQLNVPLRQQNQMLLSAGFAPLFAERKLDEPSMGPAWRAVELVLRGHEPNPAIAIDRHWNMVAANSPLEHFLSLVEDRSLLVPPINVLRLSLHPGGLAPRILNLAEWRAHLLERLRSLIEATADAGLEALEAELSGYPAGVSRTRIVHDEASAIVHPLRVRAEDTVLTFISTTTVFGTPLDVTLSELAIESFFPADEATRFAMQALAAGKA